MLLGQEFQRESKVLFKVLRVCNIALKIGGGKGFMVWFALSNSTSAVDWFIEQLEACKWDIALPEPWDWVGPCSLPKVQILLLPSKVEQTSQAQYHFHSSCMLCIEFIQSMYITKKCIYSVYSSNMLNKVCWICPDDYTCTFIFHFQDYFNL